MMPCKDPDEGLHLEHNLTGQREHIQPGVFDQPQLQLQLCLKSSLQSGLVLRRLLVGRQSAAAVP